MFFIILTMLMSMTPNRDDLSGYNTGPRASPEMFKRHKKCGRKFLPQIHSLLFEIDTVLILQNIHDYVGTLLCFGFHVLKRKKNGAVYILPSFMIFFPTAFSIPLLSAYDKA